MLKLLLVGLLALGICAKPATDKNKQDPNDSFESMINDILKTSGERNETRPLPPSRRVIEEFIRDLDKVVEDEPENIEARLKGDPDDQDNPQMRKIKDVLKRKQKSKKPKGGKLNGDKQKSDNTTSWEDNSMEINGSRSMEGSDSSPMETRNLDDITTDTSLDEFREQLQALRQKARDACGYKDSDLDDSVSSPMTPNSKLFKDIEHLQHEIEQKEIIVDELKSELVLAMDNEDEAETERIVAELEEVYETIQTLRYFLEELQELTLSIGEDLVRIDSKWTNRTRHENSTRREDGRRPGGKQKDSTVELTNQGQSLRRELKGKLLELRKTLEEFKRVECSQVPTTNDLVDEVEKLKDNSASDGACTERVQNFAGSVKEKIELFHEATEITTDVKSGLSGLYTTLYALSQMPYVGSVASTFKTVVSTAKNTVSNVQSKMTNIDNKLYPTWSDRFEDVESAAENATEALEVVTKLGTLIYSMSSESRDCICAMPSNSIKTTSISASESASSDHLPIFDTLNLAFGRIGSVCEEYDDLLSKLDNVLPSGVLNGIYNTLSDLVDALGPLFDIFGEIDAALNRKLCIPNPVEVTAEATERAWEKTQEAGNEAAETAREIKRKAKKALKGWRRKRSDNDVFIEKNEAADFLGSKLSRVRRASDICFTIQEIIDGISSAFSALLSWAEDILNEILSRVPGLDSIPGLPNFNIDFDILGNLNFPNLDIADIKIDWNVDRYFDFINIDLSLLTFDLPLEDLGVSLPNVPDLISFNPFNWNVPDFNIPDNACAVLDARKRK